MKIYIGDTAKNQLAYKVCEFSILSRNPSVNVEFINLDSLKALGIDIEQDGFTEEHLKYFVPLLADYQGWALYCDSNMLFNINPNELLSQAHDQYALMIANQNFEKASSSLIFWNCSHPNNIKLTLERLNSMPIERFRELIWLNPSMVGPINHEYNWITDQYQTPQQGIPKILNFHTGGPWQEETRGCLFGAYWEREFNKYQLSLISDPPPGPFDYIPPEIKSIFHKILHYRADPVQEHYSDGKLKDIIEDLKMIDNDNVYAVDGGWNPEEKKGLVYDPYMEAFIVGSGGRITNYDKVEQSMVPVLFRGITKMKHMKACEAAGRDYYYIDTGYFGNLRKKLYHRITKNAMQNIGPVIERPFDRLEATGWRRKKFRPGRNILICPPSAKAMSCFGQDLDLWMEQTINAIKQYTDRPIVVRKKLSRRERGTTDTMEMALDQDVHCLVTYNSIAASEALLNGKPAFTLGPNAAHSLSLQDLSMIETPNIPTIEELEAWAAHLAYSQFTEVEMRDGTAWRILNDR